MTGPRRAGKRPAEDDAAEEGAPEAKQPAPDASGDAEESNGVDA